MILGFLVNQLYGQDSLLTLKMINIQTKQTVENASVLQRNNYIGQSDEKGFLSFIKKDLDTILITHVVYEPIKFCINEMLKDTLVIKLNPKNTLLKEVVVTSKKDSLVSNDEKNRIKFYAKKFTKIYLGYLQMAKVHEERAMYIEENMVAFLECNSFLLPSTKIVKKSMLTAIPKSHARFLVNPKFKKSIFDVNKNPAGFIYSTMHFYELRRYLDYNPMLLKNLNNYVYKIVSEDENIVKIRYNYKKDKNLNITKKISGILTINKKSNLLEEFTYVCNINNDDIQTRNSATIFFHNNNNNSIYCSGGKSEYINLKKNMSIKYIFSLLNNYGPNTFVKDYSIILYNLKDFINYDINEWKSFPIKNSIFFPDLLSFNKNSDLEKEFKLGAQYLNQLNENLKGNFKIQQDALNKIYPQIIKQIQTKLKIEL